LKRSDLGWSLTFALQRSRAALLDEVPLLIVARTSMRAIARAPACRLHDNSVDLKRVPPKSRPPRPLRRWNPRSKTRRARTPPSTFLFLPIHLSNSQEPGGSAPGWDREAGEASASDRDRMALSLSSVRSFAGAQSHRKADGAPCERYIVVQGRKCQHLRPKIPASPAACQRAIPCAQAARCTAATPANFSQRPGANHGGTAEHSESQAQYLFSSSTDAAV
jgi:hypothetical protein